MLFQTGCIHFACYCCLFLGLGGFKVLCGKDRCRNGKGTWKYVAFFPLFFNTVLCFSMQGLMFGYATDETEECMPLTVLLAHKLTARIKALERNGTWPWVRPDGKTQVCKVEA